MIYTLIVISLLLLIIFNIIIKWRQLTPFDRSCLNIKTFDGLESPYHPTVLYFPKSWNGWEYWMAETPFSTRSKPYWDRNECPSIHVSHDGVIWTEPSGLKNPIIDLNNNQISDLDYFSDPHLVYLPEKDCLELWFRLTDRGGDKGNCHDVKLIRMSSSDGINWSAPQSIVSLSSSSAKDRGLGDTVVSPSILRNPKGYTMWYVDVEVPKEETKRGVSFSVSVDGTHWTDRQVVTFDRDINPWHIDVKYDEGKYIMLVYDLYNLTLWQSSDGLDFRFLKEMMTPSPRFGSVFRKLYRSCLVRDNAGYKIYVSGWDLIDTHIGLLEGKSLTDMSLRYTGWLTFDRFTKHYFYYQRRRIAFIIRNKLKRS